MNKLLQPIELWVEFDEEHFKLQSSVYGTAFLSTENIGQGYASGMFIHVIEKGAYDQILEQANKLAEGVVCICEDVGPCLYGSDEIRTGWQEFKKSQGIND